MCQLEHEVTYVYVHTRRQGLSEVEIHGCWHGHACDSSPCQNGGVCHERPYSYACRCPRGYSGDRCCEQNTSIVPAESCAHLLNHSRSTTNCGDSLRSGTVQVRSVGRTTAPAYCDVQRHGGGWQLVGLSNGGRTAIWGGLGANQTGSTSGSGPPDVTQDCSNANASFCGEFVAPLRTRSPSAVPTPCHHGCLPPLEEWQQPCGVDLAQGHLSGAFASHDLAGFMLSDMVVDRSFELSRDTVGWAAQVSPRQPRQLALFFHGGSRLVSQYVLTSGSASGGRVTAGSLLYTNDRGYLDLHANWQPVRNLTVRDLVSGATIETWNSNEFNASEAAAAVALQHAVQKPIGRGAVRVDRIDVSQHKIHGGDFVAAGYKPGDVITVNHSDTHYEQLANESTLRAEWAQARLESDPPPLRIRLDSPVYSEYENRYGYASRVLAHGISAVEVAAVHSRVLQGGKYVDREPQLGLNYGFSNRTLWVDRGLRADFLVEVNRSSSSSAAHSHLLVPLELPARETCSILRGGPVQLRVVEARDSVMTVDAASFPAERYDEENPGECVVSRPLLGHLVTSMEFEPVRVTGLLLNITDTDDRYVPCVRRRRRRASTRDRRHQLDMDCGGCYMALRVCTVGLCVRVQHTAVAVI